MKKIFIVSLFVFLSLSFVLGVSPNIDKIIIVPVPTSDLTVDIEMNKPTGSTYSSGENIEIYFKTNKNAYVAIYDILPDGQVQLLFPNAYDSNNFALANTRIKVPTNNQYNLMVGPSDSGKEILQIIASTTPLGFLSDLTTQFNSSPFPSPDQSAENFVQNIVIPSLQGKNYAVNSIFFFANTYPKTGKISVSSNPSGASIYVDGIYVGNAPVTTSIDTGNHYVVGYLNGQSKSQMINVNSGQTANVFLQFSQQTATLNVNSNPSGADVYIDNQYKGQSPVSISLNPGTYTLKLQKAGYETYNEQFNLSTTLTKNINLTPTVKNYDISFSSNPSGAKIYINNQYKGTTPKSLTLEEGNYTARLSMNGYEDYTETINLDRNISRNITLTPIQQNYNLSVSSNPSGASIYLNNSYYGQTPMTVSLIEGNYNLQLQMNGYDNYTETINLNRNISRNITLTPIQQNYNLSISSNPSNASVYINNSYYGKTPMNITLMENNYSLEIEKSGYVNYTETINLNRDISRNITLTPETKNYNLNLKSNPNGASVYLNNTYYGVTPINLNLQEGNYDLLLQLNGYEDYSTTINLNRNITKTFTLNEITAEINISVDPTGVKLYVNGKSYGTVYSSGKTVEIGVGYNEITLIKEGYRTIVDYKYFNFGSTNLNYSMTPLN
ncbi:MAG: hypothetical protein PWQ77_583 [Kosmotogales bacterium]|nr:hypothetical protein [Kosmotogales bacterium]